MSNDGVVNGVAAPMTLVVRLLIAIFAITSVLTERTKPNFAQKFEVTERCFLGRPNSNHRLMNFNEVVFLFSWFRCGSGSKRVAALSVR